MLNLPPGNASASSRRRAAATFPALLAAALLLGTPVPNPAWGQAFYPPVQSGTIQNNAVVEASGLVASRTTAGVLWVHNDGGPDAFPRVYAMNGNGGDLGTYTVTGAAKVDWEDIAAGPGPSAAERYLYLADVGDNAGSRSSITIYRTVEPTVAVNQPAGMYNTAASSAFHFTYPDGPRDAETLLVDPLNDDWYVLTKQVGRTRVYRAAAPHAPGGPTALAFLGDIGFGIATAGDVSADGSRILLRSYTDARLFSRAPNQTLFEALSAAGSAVPLANEPQGEAIAWSAANDSYFTTSEGQNPPIYRYDPVPEPGGAAACVLSAAAAAGLRRRRRSPLV